jgi:hypothetical protein
VAGVYDLRLADAHPTSSKVAEALALARINPSLSFLRQGEQLIYNFGSTLWMIGEQLFRDE